jgi:hypothetical protein
MESFKKNVDSMNGGGAKHPFVDLKGLQSNVEAFNSGHITLPNHPKRKQ